jgi:hypothetical protein
MKALCKIVKNLTFTFLQKRSDGRAARLSSAKAATPVRIRFRPQQKKPANAGFFISALPTYSGHYDREI